MVANLSIFVTLRFTNQRLHVRFLTGERFSIEQIFTFFCVARQRVGVSKSGVLLSQADILPQVATQVSHCVSSRKGDLLSRLLIDTLILIRHEAVVGWQNVTIKAAKIDTLSSKKIRKISE